jgi:hypothetical protein
MGLLSKAVRASKVARKARRATQDLFADKFSSQLDEGQAPSRGTLDVESGRAGKVTRGKRSMPNMKEALSMGSRKRSKVVAELETKKEKGTITKEEDALLTRLNRLSREADEARTSAAAKTRREKTSKDKGVTLSEMGGGRRTVGKKEKLKASDMMVGNTENGITKDGEVIGNPTDNQINTVIRNMNAREKLSAEAKRNLAKLNRLSQKERQDMAINKMERNMYNTGPDRKAKGGMARKKFNKGGYANCGASMKATQKSTMACGGMAKHK